MRESSKVSAFGCGVAVALFLGLFVAVWGVGQTGDCWSNCVADEDTVMSPWPLAVWAAALGASWMCACAYVWARSLCRTDSRGRRWVSAATASTMTVPLVWALTLVVR